MTRLNTQLAVLLIAVIAGSGFAGTGPEDQFTFLAGELPDSLLLQDSPYMALADVYIDYASFLYVEAGVEVQFTSGVALEMNNEATITCDGTTIAPIVFHDAGLGEWDGISIGLSAGTYSIALANVSIGGAVDGIKVTYHENSTSVDMSLVNIVVNNCSGAGIDFHGTPNMPPPGNYDISGLSVSGAAIGLNLYGIPSGYFTVQSSEIFGNTTGIRVEQYSTNGGLHGTDLYVHGNDYGFDIQSLVEPVVVNSSEIRDNTTYDVRAMSSVSTVPAHNFQDNDWGVTTTQEMIDEGTFADITSIYDWWDNPSKSLVDYSGFAGGPTTVPQGSVEITSWGGVKELFR